MHVEDVVAPVTLEYMPAGHCAHSASTGTSPYVPAGHTWQLLALVAPAALAGMNFPSQHWMQVAEDVAPVAFE